MRIVAKHLRTTWDSRKRVWTEVLHEKSKEWIWLVAESNPPRQTTPAATWLTFSNLLHNFANNSRRVLYESWHCPDRCPVSRSFRRLNWRGLWCRSNDVRSRVSCRPPVGAAGSPLRRKWRKLIHYGTTAWENYVLLTTWRQSVFSQAATFVWCCTPGQVNKPEVSTGFLWEIPEVRSIFEPCHYNNSWFFCKFQFLLLWSNFARR